MFAKIMETMETFTSIIKQFLEIKWFKIGAVTCSVLSNDVPGLITHFLKHFSIIFCKNIIKFILLI